MPIQLFFLIGAFRATSGHKFRLSLLFRSVFDVHSLRVVRRKKLLSMPENVSTVYRNFEILYNSKTIHFLYGRYVICCQIFVAIRFLEEECKAEIVSINIPELEVGS